MRALRFAEFERCYGSDPATSTAAIAFGSSAERIPSPSQYIAEVVYLTASIATSGTYQRGNHLIDPYTSRPTARVASASVTGPDVGLADALATALALAGAPGLDLIEALDGYEALAIALDGSRRWTQQFPFAPHEAGPLR